MSKQLIEWNDKKEEPQELSEDELPKDPPGYVPQREPETPELDMEAVGGYAQEAQEDEEYNEYLEEQDDTAILTDARERLERGRLYELLMTSDIFANLDADPKAIKNVQREIRRFAKDRMEVMLGIKKNPEVVHGSDTNQFNSLQVEILRTLANKLSGGVSSDPKQSGPALAPKSATLTPISNGHAKKPVPLSKSAPARTAPRAPAQPQAKPITQVDPVLASKKIEDMTYEEKLEYNRQKSALYESRKVANPESIPMPSAAAMGNVYAAKSGAIKTGYAKLDQIAASMVKR